MKTKSKKNTNGTTKPIRTQQATLWAKKKPKAKSPPAWMPDEVAVSLSGEPGPKGLLITGGWTMAPREKWVKARLEANLDRLAEEWAQEVSKGWVLEIR
ncbi:MAG: hypothetical protein NT062_36835 [Proteobacteria bacterium]|nr:hypothetical protein [Pseudomonadota bacterium]